MDELLDKTAKEMADRLLSTVGCQEAAEYLGIDRSNFSRNWRRWIRENRFPEPIFNEGHPRWHFQDIVNYNKRSA